MIHSARPLLAFDEVPTLLATKLRLLSLDQIATLAFGDAVSPERAARQAIHRSVARGVLTLDVGLARAELCLDAPLYVGTSIDAASIELAGRLSYRARRRWTHAYQATRYVQATAHSRLAHGVTSSVWPIRSGGELTHDVHVSEIFLSFLADQPARSAGWIGESELHDLHLQCRPDAMIHEPDGSHSFIDFLGSYSAPKIQRMLALYAVLGTRFEFW